MNDTIRVLSRVCASFRLPDGGVFEIGPDRRWLLLEAPAAIRTDPLFTWLVEDGSMEVAGLTALTATLENEPDRGATAEGRKPRKTAAGGKNAANGTGGKAAEGGADGAGSKTAERGADSLKGRLAVIGADSAGTGNAASADKG